MTEQTDRELLEMAAKAAGLNAVDSDNAGLRISSDGCCTGYRWNSFADDGDALRLMVDVEFELRVFNGKAHAGRQNKFWCTEVINGDKHAASRRAITRAAAEIGKAML